MNTETTHINEKAIAEFFRWEHARVGLNRSTTICMNYSESGIRWQVYGSTPPVGFVCEHGNTLDEAAAEYRKASDISARVAKLRREASELESMVKKMELAQ
jgi:hypothetical protein